MWQKAKKILLYLGVISLILLLISQIHILMFNDISTEPISSIDNVDFQSTKTENRPPVYLVSYADGSEVFFKNQNALALSALNKGIDFILNYRRTHLEENFSKKNSHILQDRKRGAGYWAWKPYIILKTMEKAPEGAIIIYSDTGFIFCGSIAIALEKIKQYDIILNNYHPSDHQTVENVVKRDALIKMNCDTEECRKSPHILSGFLILKNTPISRAFIKQWLEYCEDPTILMDEPSMAQEYPNYKGHKQDQAILTVLNYKMPKGVIAMPFAWFSNFVFLHHRKWGNEFRSLIPRMHKGIRGIETKFLNGILMIQLRTYLLPRMYTNHFIPKQQPR